MRLRWRKAARTVEPRQMVSTKAQELEAAKQILSEVFHVRPADIEEMIQQRLEDGSSPDDHKDGLWPVTFSLGE